MKRKEELRFLAAILAVIAVLGAVFVLFRPMGVLKSSILSAVIERHSGGRVLQSAEIHDREDLDQLYEAAVSAIRHSRKKSKLTNYPSPFYVISFQNGMGKNEYALCWICAESGYFFTTDRPGGQRFFFGRRCKPAWLEPLAELAEALLDSE